MVDIDISDAETPKELQKTFKESLQFPDFYGMNWGAFWDACTGLVEMPDVMIIHGFELYRLKQPGDAKTLQTYVNRLRSEWGFQILMD